MILVQNNYIFGISTDTTGWTTRYNRWAQLNLVLHKRNHNPVSEKLGILFKMQIKTENSYLYITEGHNIFTVEHNKLRKLIIFRKLLALFKFSSNK